MKFGVPWSVKGIRPEARETARQAARRSGMSLGDWLNTMILQQSAQGGMQGQLFSDEDEDSYGDELAGVHHRLDDLTRRIEQFTRKGPEAYAPRHHQRAEPDQLAALIERLDRRIEQFSGFAQAMQPMMAPPLAPSPRPDFYAFPQSSPPNPSALDRAVAEVAARQRALNGEPPPRQQTQQPEYNPAPPMPPMSRPPLPTQDISGLEEQLRKITDQIETLRRPGVEEAIQALRGELGDIGRALNDAMPRRAIDTLERQIQGLTQRIAEGRQAGADGGTLSNIEYGLSEVRDALRGLTPAENLIGFNDAVAALAQKIDLIVAQKDPATLQQLESAITMLRSMAGNVASDEAVSRLAEEVQILAEKVEQIGRGPASDVLNSLEARIDALSRALAERAQNGNSVPPRLESLVQSLSDKIEQIQHSRSDSLAVNHLEDRIVHLVEKLDASEGRLGHLEAIERGLADLLLHIEDMRTNGPAASNAEPLQAVDELKSDIARTHDALDAVHGTLGVLVDRMAMLERNMRAERPPAPAAVPAAPSEEAELKQPPGRVAVRLVSDQPPPEPPVAPAAVQPLSRLPPVMPLAVAPEPPPLPRRMTANRPPIDPDLPPDQPLEPGSGRPRIQDHPSARIAASEAALGSARPAAPAAGSPANFIAAARRAAQAALRHQPTAAPRAAEPPLHEAGETDGRSLRAKMMKRMKSLFIAASIVAIVVGSIQIVGSMLLGGARTKTAQEHHARAAHEEIVTPESKSPVKLADRPASAMPAYNMLTPPGAGYGAGTVASLFNPPGLSSSTDITGSIPETAASKAPAVTNRTRAQDRSDGLPSEIGSQALRNAATSGNAAAAYEVALRFAEGRGVSTNLERAAHWYERAAAKGLALAQFRYASMLEKGQGVKKDLNAARKLYLAAAGQGNAKAMHNLAVLYAEGIDGRPDYATAAKWFRDAAQHGVADSQYNLAILYARGIGVPKDMGESYKWFALAAAHGDRESAKKRDELAAHLDAKGLAQARHEVATFVVKPQPASATTVPVPPGGWDRAAAPSAKSRPHSAGPMVIGRR